MVSTLTYVERMEERECVGRTFDVGVVMLESAGNERRHRRTLLIDGRRVRITELIAADLLKPGDELYQRFAGQDPYRAHFG